MKLYSWNVNGLRAVLRKGFLDWLKAAAPDVLCLQETKAAPAQLPPELKVIPGYEVRYEAAEKPGYSGVATFSRVKPKAVNTTLGAAPEFDREGRILISEYEGFTLLNVYFPNGKASDERLAYKMAFYDAFLDHCRQRRAAGESLIICGDVNTAHNEIDLARPRENEQTSGFLRCERDWLDRFVAAGFVDTFRRRYPETADAYSWWSLRSGARQRNVGWRLDYFFVSEDLWPRVRNAAIHAEVPGSDHCPVSLDIDI